MQRQWTLESRVDLPVVGNAKKVGRLLAEALRRKRFKKWEPVPCISETITPYQWVFHGVRVIAEYRTIMVDEAGWYMRADAMTAMRRG